MRFLLNNPLSSYQYKIFENESNAIAAAKAAIEEYRDEGATYAEWDESIINLAVYQIPDGVGVEDCTDYGIAESGCQLLWQAVESGDDTDGYDYRLEQVKAGGASE